MKVYVIRCNDAVMGVVVGTEEFAKAKMEWMRRCAVDKHFRDYGESTTRSMAPMFWRLQDFVLLSEVRDLVREALDNADGDGWSQKDERVEDMARSLQTYCADLEDVAEVEILPHVVEWKRDKGYPA